jgi:hypothetical protein
VEHLLVHAWVRLFLASMVPWLVVEQEPLLVHESVLLSSASKESLLAVELELSKKAFAEPLLLLERVRLSVALMALRLLVEREHSFVVLLERW